MTRANASRCSEEQTVNSSRHGRVASARRDAKQRRRGQGAAASGQVTQALTRTLQAAAPWLLDLGTWIFGALIAFAVLMLGALLTVGPVDRAMLISTAAFAVGLPPEVGAFLLLRLVRDLEENKIEQIATRSFEEAGVDNVDDFLPVEANRTEGTLARRMVRVLGASYALLGVSVGSAVVGISALLWHMGWWIAVAFLSVLVVMQFVVFRVILQPPKAPAKPAQQPRGEDSPPA